MVWWMINLNLMPSLLRFNVEKLHMMENKCSIIHTFFRGFLEDYMFNLMKVVLQPLVIWCQIRCNSWIFFTTNPILEWFETRPNGQFDANWMHIWAVILCWNGGRSGGKHVVSRDLFAPCYSDFLHFQATQNREISEPVSWRALKKTTVNLPWCYRELDPKSIYNDPKSINNDREIPVKKPWKYPPCWLQCCFQIKHPVQTMDDINAMMEAGKAIREKMHTFHAQNFKINGSSFAWTYLETAKGLWSTRVKTRQFGPDIIVLGLKKYKFWQWNLL